MQMWLISMADTHGVHEIIWLPYTLGTAPCLLLQASPLVGLRGHSAVVGTPPLRMWEAQQGLACLPLAGSHSWLLRCRCSRWCAMLPLPQSQGGATVLPVAPVAQPQLPSKQLCSTLFHPVVRQAKALQQHSPCAAPHLPGCASCCVRCCGHMLQQVRPILVLHHPRRHACHLPLDGHHHALPQLLLPQATQPLQGQASRVRPAQCCTRLHLLAPREGLGGVGFQDRGVDAERKCQESAVPRGVVVTPQVHADWR
jgi:hypothetical protein